MIAELLDMTDLASYFGTCRRIRDLPSKWVDWVCKKVFEVSKAEHLSDVVAINAALRESKQTLTAIIGCPEARVLLS